MQELKTVLEDIYSSKIISHNIDFLKNNIFFKLEIFESDSIKHYNIIFEDVFSYYYNRGLSIESRNEILSCYLEKNVEEEDEEEGFIEADYIYYLPKGTRDRIKIISGNKREKWQSQYHAEVNFLIELTWGIFLIEANSITINDKKFTGLIDLIEL